MGVSELKRETTSDAARPTSTMRQLEMKYAGGGIVRHLGLQSYRGAVPALAELIANSWDADASEVYLSIPLDSPIGSMDVISIRDNGCGMDWNDCAEKYLVIGRNRREAEGTDRSPSCRPLMAHKGLGKLAGFGIANVVEVRTIRNKKLVHFVMEFYIIDKLNQGETYRPRMLADEKDIESKDSTEIILRDLNLQKAISKDQFFRSMASKFAILSDNFKVFVNGEPLEKTQYPFQFRFPEKVGDGVVKMADHWGVTNLPPEIKWWIGFTEKPIQHEGIQGVRVITRGKSSQDPWDFGLAGGAHGQHGLRYMVGEIIADFLDEGLKKESDLILTNRSGIKWEDPKAAPLYDWVREKIKDLLGVWAERRSEKVVKDVQKERPELVRMIEQFQPRERKELNSVMKKLAEVPTIEPDRLGSIFEYVIDGYKDKAFVDMLEEIKDMPPEDQVRTLGVLKEFDVLEAVRVHEIVSSHVRVIRAFKDMIDAGVPEKPDMHDHIKKYPWLLGIRYQSMDYEQTMQKILEKHFGVEINEAEGKKRPDFVCLRGGNQVVVIDLKRPGDTVGMKELQQISGYVDHLREWVETGTAKSSVGTKIHSDDVEGYLVAYNIQNDAAVRRESKRLENDHIHVWRWDEILGHTEDDHREYLNIIKSRAPKDDPRVVELEKKKIV